MKITIKPGTAFGRIKAHPSKSDAHRLIIAAALSKGESEIKEIEQSEDIKATVNAVKQLGATCVFNGNNLKITASGARLSDGAVIDCNESGSTLRFMIPILLIFNKKATLIGSPRLFERPLGIYEKICEKENLTFQKIENGIELKGPLKGGRYDINGDISSQFITGLLFALPLLKTDSEIKIIPPVESRPYIEITLDVLKKAGIKVDLSENNIYIYGNQLYSPLREYVEKDWSNAAFLDAFNLIGGNVRIEGLNHLSKQGDKIYKEFFSLFRHSSPSQHPPEINIADAPDLAPVTMALAAAKGGAVLTGTKRLKFKESDRGAAMKEELSKFGIETEIEENKITVKIGILHSPISPLRSHNDHRIAMALSIPASITGATIEGAEAVRKSYPEYWKDIEKLGIEVIYE